MGFLVRLFLALVIAVALGATTAWFSLDSIAETDFAANGAWRVLPDVRDTKLGLYERAALAKVNLLAPDRRDALDLIAFRDEASAPLVAKCTYRVEVATLPAQTWSITPHDSRQHVIGEPLHLESAPGSYVLLVGRSDAQGHLLPIGGNGKFSLILRLHNPEPNAVAAPSSFNAPRIIKEACQ
jgi:hypothetical protein